MNRYSAATKQSLPAFGRNQGPQFLPECEEEDLPEQNTMSPRQVYLHDEEDYLERMQTKANPTETPNREKNLGNVMHPDDHSVAEDSPVAKLFGHRGYNSDTGLPTASGPNENPPKRNSYPQIAKDVDSKDTTKTRVPNTVERDIQKQIDAQLQNDRKSDELQLHVQMDTPPELQFESKSEEIGRVKRLRESYLQRLENTRRLSEAEESRRQSVESKLEQMRAEATAEEFVQQNVVQKVKEPTVPFDESNEALRGGPFDEDQENRAPRGRASAPVERSTNAVRFSKPVRKSEPVLIPKKKFQAVQQKSERVNTLPVLLKIAGWEQATRSCVPQPLINEKEPELPAILALAGWKKEANQKKQPQMSMSEHVTRMQETTNNHVKPAEANNSYKVDALKEDRAIKKAASRDSSHTEEDEQRIPLPYTLQRNSPNETPVVKKMSRMLMETRNVASAFDTPEERNQYGELKLKENLDESIDSVATPLSEVGDKPMLTKDALVNAAFLFSPGYVDNNPSLLRMGDAKSETTTTISTLDSRNRLLPSYTGRNASESELSESSAILSASTKTKSGIYTSSSTASSYSSHREASEKPHPVLKHNSSMSSRSTDSTDRHVRFSIGNKVVVSSAQKPVRKSDELSIAGKSPLRSDNLEVPGINHTMSDLTDIFSSTDRDSIVTLETQKSNRFTKESIQEPPQDSPTVVDNETQLGPSPPTNWGYSTDMDNGVTPLRSGKGGGSSNATNSVYKRFNQAKNRFSPATKESPVKKHSPVKVRPSKMSSVGGIVHQRVAAMEQQIYDPLQKTRRDTLGHKVIAPRRANLRSAYFKKPSPQKPSPQKISPLLDTKNGLKSVSRRISSTASRESSSECEIVKKISPTAKSLSDKPVLKRWSASSSSDSSMSRQGKAFEKQPQYLHGNSIQQVASRFSYSTTSLKEDSTYNKDIPDEDSDSDSDAFGTIRRTSTVDQEEKDQAQKIVGNLVKAYTRTSNSSHESASTEIDDDDFAAILQYQSSVDEDDDSDAGETVSTIQRHRLSLGSSTVMSGGTAPTVVRLSPHGDVSVASGGTLPPVARRSSVLSGSTAPTVVRRERDLAVSRAPHASYPPTKKLPFRDAAPVRPNEQYHRAVPGALVLSPMQRTPMQALKWRALAAAEKEKNDRKLPIRKSLSERNPNVIGR
eukprot:scaffold4252_cov176-Amphora_coffeaeformis.AAC.3